MPKKKMFLPRKLAQAIVKKSANDAAEPNPRTSFPAVLFTFLDAPELLTTPKSNKPIEIKDNLKATLENLQMSLPETTSKKTTDRTVEEFQTAAVNLYDQLNDYNDMKENGKDIVDPIKAKINVALERLLSLHKTTKELREEKIDAIVKNPDWLPQLMAVYDKFHDIRNNFELAALNANFKKIDTVKFSPEERDAREAKREAELRPLDDALMNSILGARAVPLQRRTSETKPQAPTQVEPPKPKQEQPTPKTSQAAPTAPRNIAAAHQDAFRTLMSNRANRVNETAAQLEKAAKAAEIKKTDIPPPQVFNQVAATRAKWREAEQSTQQELKGKPLERVGRKPGPKNNLVINVRGAKEEPAPPTELNNFTMTPVKPPTASPVIPPTTRQPLSSGSGSTTEPLFSRSAPVSETTTRSQSARSSISSPTSSSPVEANQDNKAAPTGSDAIPTAVVSAEAAYITAGLQQQANQRQQLQQAAAVNINTPAPSAAATPPPRRLTPLENAANVAPATRITPPPGGKLKDRISQLNQGKPASADTAQNIREQREQELKNIREAKIAQGILANLRNPPSSKPEPTIPSKTIASPPGADVPLAPPLSEAVNTVTPPPPPAAVVTGADVPPPPPAAVVVPGAEENPAPIAGANEVEEEDMGLGLTFTEQEPAPFVPPPAAVLTGADVPPPPPAAIVVPAAEENPAPIAGSSEEEEDMGLGLTFTEQEPAPFVAPPPVTSTTVPPPAGTPSADLSNNVLPGSNDELYDADDDEEENQNLGSPNAPGSDVVPPPNAPGSDEVPPPDAPGSDVVPPLVVPRLGARRPPPPIPLVVPSSTDVPPPIPLVVPSSTVVPPPLPARPVTPSSTIKPAQQQNTQTSPQTQQQQATSTILPPTSTTATTTATAVAPATLLKNWDDDLVKDILRLARAANDSTALARTQSQMELMRLKALEFKNANFDNLAEREKLKEQWLSSLEPLTKKIAENTARLIVSKDNLPNCIKHLEANPGWGNWLKAREARSLLPKSEANLETYQQMWTQLESIKQSFTATNQSDYTDRIRFTGSKVVKFPVNPGDANGTAAEFKKQYTDLCNRMDMDKRDSAQLALSVRVREEAKVDVKNEMVIVAIKGYDSSGLNMNCDTVFSVGPSDPYGSLSLSVHQMREDASPAMVLANFVLDSQNNTNMPRLMKYFPELQQATDVTAARKILVDAFQGLPAVPRYNDIYNVLASRSPPDVSPIGSYLEVSKFAKAMNNTISNTVGNPNKPGLPSPETMLLAKEMVEDMRNASGGKTIIVEPTCPPSLKLAVKIYCDAKMKESKDQKVKVQYDYFDPQDPKRTIHQQEMKSLRSFTQGILQQAFWIDPKIDVNAVKKLDNINDPSKFKADVSYGDQRKLDDIHIKSDRDNRSTNRLHNALNKIDSKAHQVTNPDIQTEIDKQVSAGPKRRG